MALMTPGKPLGWGVSAESPPIHLQNPMASERTFQDRYQRGTSLRDAVATLAPAYSPPDPKFTLAALTAALAAADAANTAVTDKRALYEDDVSDRQALVKTLGPLVTQSLAHIKGNTAWAKRYDAVKKAADKVRGVRPAAPKKGADPEPDAKTREKGERSFVEIAAFFKAYLARLSALAGYAPTDDAIKLPALEAAALQLDDLNQSVSALSQDLADAIRDRADAYTGPAGLKFVFDGVKTSVKGQYGQKSPNYSAVSGMKW